MQSSISATYSPEDNKLRLYSVSRLPPELYARVKAAGYSWAPRQECFIAPAWSPARADLAEELAGEIGDEDSTLMDRAEDRAERFDGYRESRERDHAQAHAAVSAIADNIPLGQPILVGHHSEKRARKDAERIQDGMRRAVKMWETAEYWKGRAAAAVRHAKYKERPDVRARRIKTLEADKRKQERAVSENRVFIRLWESITARPDYIKNHDGTPTTLLERAQYVAGRCHITVYRDAEAPYGFSAWDVLQPDGERFKACPAWTPEQVQEYCIRACHGYIAHAERWIAHLENRLAYERAMLEESGGTVAQKTGPEKGGAVRCWASPRGGWSYIQKVNRVSVTVLDNWGNGGPCFSRTIPFDKLAGVMTAAEVQAARDCGTLAEIGAEGFILRGNGDDGRARRALPDKAPEEKEAAEKVEAMKETLRAGVQVVAVPQLFPTPRDLAQRMADLADIRPGNRVLEPSAGTGMLLGACGGRMFGHDPERGAVVAVELVPALAERLAADYPLTTVICADFLDFAGATENAKFDRIIMNPPFQNGADIEHIRHAAGLLKPGGRLVALCANGPRQRDALQPIASSWEDLPPGTFKEAGTLVNVALLVIQR